jgi:F0F1-type ATP synthase membrane subunit b/b'|tara:strand:+ start:474 stop:608 length:135 start_codon:yes stop_codon:yes gene_type:complete
MTEEEVKALIKELRDEIPAIIQKLHEEAKEEGDKAYQKYLKDNK